jgi:hypothetical protein
MHEKPEGAKTMLQSGKNPIIIAKPLYLQVLTYPGISEPFIISLGICRKVPR